MPSWIGAAIRHPSAVLLAAQLLGVVLYPFMDGPTGRAALSLFGIVVLVLAVWALRTTPALTWVSLLLGLPVVVLTTSENEDDVLHSYSLHANAYVTKPVDFARFIEVVRQIDDFFVTVVRLPRR